MAYTSVLTEGRFWAAAFERAIFTGAQSLAASLSAFTVADMANIVGLPWAAVLSITAFSVLFSFITSVAKAGATGAPGLAEKLRGPADGYTGPAQEPSAGEKSGK